VRSKIKHPEKSFYFIISITAKKIHWFMFNYRADSKEYNKRVLYYV